MATVEREYVICSDTAVIVANNDASGMTPDEETVIRNWLVLEPGYMVVTDPIESPGLSEHCDWLKNAVTLKD